MTSAKDFGRDKFLVETFVTERHVVTVFADSEADAISAVKKAYRRTDIGTMAVRLFDNGVYTVHHDEDYDFKLSFGDVIKDEDGD